MTSNDCLVEVAVALPVFNTFTYRVEPSMAALIGPGKRVLVPFGRRRITGYIFGPGQDVELLEIKHVLDVLDEAPLFPASMIAFFKWIAAYYKHPIGDVVKNALPGGLTIFETAMLTLADKGRRDLKKGELAPLEARILNALEAGPCQARQLNKRLGRQVPIALVQALENQQRIRREWKLQASRTRPKLERFVCLKEPVTSAEHLSPACRHILAIIADEKELPVRDLRRRVPRASALVRSLAGKGYVSIVQRRVYRDPLGAPIEADVPPVLTREQQRVVNQAGGLLGKGFATMLLHGVTGSGKTEVYMQVAAQALADGYEVLVLVPEIVLITQIERRFRARFGQRVAVLHSGLSSGERYDQWGRILAGEAKITIGARSAVFAPHENLGLIVVDEEHDGSYKQESSLRYNARDLAIVRAKQSGCLALLGSATPSVQSYYNVAHQKYVLAELTQRIEQRPLPEIQIVDLRLQRDTRGIKRFLTPPLRQAMQATLERGEQVLLFLNRRGYASFPVCGSCGQALRCEHCDISLTLHRSHNAFKCHYCGYTRASSSPCTACGSSNIRSLGMGTEKVEQAVREVFPHATVARMDRDTTARKGSILKLLKDLKNRSIDVLVGTQMVAKGHDFPNITLVGIVCADLSLSFPDFRAGERTFQLLAQVAGRAGRGASPGMVILQTYYPDHFSILAAKSQDFGIFYKQEIGIRKALAYPPFSRMVQFRIAGKNPSATREIAQRLGRKCHQLKNQRPHAYHGLEILGPIEAPLPKIAEHYRWQMLLKGSPAKTLHCFVERLVAENPSLFGQRPVKVILDVDPHFMM